MELKFKPPSFDLVKKVFPDLENASSILKIDKANEKIFFEGTSAQLKDLIRNTP